MFVRCIDSNEYRHYYACVCVRCLLLNRTGYGRCAEICSERAPCGERLKWWWSLRRRQRPKWKNYFTNRVCWIYIPCFLILFDSPKTWLWVIYWNVKEKIVPSGKGSRYIVLVFHILFSPFSRSVIRLCAHGSGHSVLSFVLAKTSITAACRAYLAFHSNQA